MYNEEILQVDHFRDLEIFLSINPLIGSIYTEALRVFGFFKK